MSQHPSSSQKVRWTHLHWLPTCVQQAQQCDRRPVSQPTRQSAARTSRPSQSWTVSKSLNHLREVQQVHSSPSPGRYLPPTGSLCSLSTVRSELRDTSARQEAKLVCLTCSSLKPGQTRGSVLVLPGCCRNSSGVPAPPRTPCPPRAR